MQTCLGETEDNCARSQAHGPVHADMPGTTTKINGSEVRMGLRAHLLHMKGMAELELEEESFHTEEDQTLR